MGEAVKGAAVNQLQRSSKAFRKKASEGSTFPRGKTFTLRGRKGFSERELVFFKKKTAGRETIGWI